MCLQFLEASSESQALTSGFAPSPGSCLCTKTFPGPRDWLMLSSVGGSLLLTQDSKCLILGSAAAVKASENLW